MKRSVALAGLLAVMAACSAAEPVASTTTSTSLAVTTTTTTIQIPMAVTTPSFDDMADIPVEFTCDGANVNPELTIVGLPPSTNHLVVLVEDPDAPLGTWVHWLEYDIPVQGDNHTIAEDAGVIGIQGLNSWNLPGYGGPCPPPGETHDYLFKVFALNEPLDLPEGVDVEAVDQEMAGKTVGEAQVTGRYGR